MVQGSAAAVTRDDRLARYRQLRKISSAQQDVALDSVSRETILDLARRLGLTRGRVLVCENPDQMALIFDLAVHTGRPGRSRAIDRYAQRMAARVTGDEAMMLRAAQAARFRMWRVERPHEILGLWVVDDILDARMWLIDEGMEATCQVGDIWAGRLMAVEDFVMACGASVPVTEMLASAAGAGLAKITAGSREDMLNDPRFAISLFRAAIEIGTMDRVQFLDAEELALTLGSVD